MSSIKISYCSVKDRMVNREERNMDKRTRGGGKGPRMETNIIFMSVSLCCVLEPKSQRIPEHICL